MKTFIVAVAALALLGGAARVDVFAQQQPAAAAAATAVPPAVVDGLLAPIALYPDQLLAQMLLCAADPPKVTELNSWLAANKQLKGTELQDAATARGFEPSFVALALFPQVVAQMATQLPWTTQLGKVFAADRSGVFAGIQRLRKEATASGALKSTPQQTVQAKTTTGGDQVIVIEPANSQVVYVPQYDPQAVYGQPTSTTVVVQQDDDDDEEALAAGLIGFTAGIAMGAAIDNSYYYGPYGWHGGFYMYDDAWDDWSDAREDAREDWSEHRENVVEERGERAGEAREQRTERAEDRQGARTESQAQRTERQQTRQEARPEAGADAQAAREARSAGATSPEARGYSRGSSDRTRSGTSSDAFSGYSSGKSQRSASARGQRSRSSSRGGGGRRR
jgi:hypothetical protein